MDWNSIIPSLIGVLGGGTVGAILMYKLGSRKQDVNEFTSIISEYKNLMEKQDIRFIALEKKVSSLEERHEKNQHLIGKYEKEVSDLRNQLLIFEGSHIDLPLPMWMKDTKGTMIFLNDYYEDALLAPMSHSMRDYLGKNDYAIWPKDIAEKSISNDKAVMRTKKSLRTVETLSDGSGGVYYADVLRYPRKLNNNIIGVSGIILKTSKDKEELM
jgi:hypothetical protein